MENEFRRYAKEAFRLMDDAARHATTTQISEYLRGEMPAGPRAEFELHVAACAACSGRLQEFREFLSDAGGPAPHNLDREFHQLRGRIRRRTLVSAAPRWGAIAAGVAIAVGASWYGWRELRPDPVRLLAQAYREQRTSEFRLAGAAFAPVRQERGAGSAFSRPAALLKAEAWLAERIKQRPEDPELLRLQGEAEMMARVAAPAVRTLARARDLRPDDPRILADLGVAYALRGDAERQFQDYVSAIDALGRSHKLDPGDAETIFNLALTLEKSLQYDQAVEQWQAYLKLDPAGPWSAEARGHLAAVQEKIQAREKALHGVVSEPGEFLRLAGAGPVDVEAYLRDPALNEWAPRAASDATARQALERLAQLLTARGDSWLADVVKAGIPPGLSQGFAKVTAADRLMNDGNVDAALAAIHEASSLLLRAGSRTADFRARLSEVLILKNALRTEECIAAAERLSPELESRPYPWLRARLQIEHAVCLMRSGRLSDAAILLRQAIRTGDALGFGGTGLRARRMYLASIGQIGFPFELFDTAAGALRTFWSGAHAPLDYYSILDELRESSRRSGQIYAAQLLARSALWGAQATKSRIWEAAAHANLAAAALAAGAAEESRVHIEQSERLYAGVPAGYRVGPQLAFANVELEQNRVNSALLRLEGLRADAASGPTVNTVAYYAALGESYRRKGRPAEAMAAFRESLAAGERRLHSMADEPERAGVLQAIESSCRGMVTVTLDRGSAVAALDVWRKCRQLDSVGTPLINAPDPRPRLWFIEQPEGYLAWLDYRGRVDLHRIGASKDAVQARVRHFLASCSDPASSPRLLMADARQLYEWLVAPFDATIGDYSGTVIMDLDGALAGVPVQALESSDRYLVDRFPTLISTGAGVPASWAPRTGDRTGVVVNPAIMGESAARFPPLPDSVREADAIRESFPSSVLEGRNAVASAVAQLVTAADIVHFAGHGYTTAGGGALILAPADPARADYDLLRPAALRREQWSRCRLVVLSACATAAGQSQGSHNPESLVRALTRMGVPLVVASSWNVDSRATAELMRSFYGSLARGASPDESLRGAQRELRRRPEWQHPYYWAGFQLYGST